MSFLARLLPSLPLLALAPLLPACGPTVVGCQEDNAGGGFLPDGSFEEQPTQWSLAPHSTIDDEQGVCGGLHSLRVELDQGLGSADVTRSAPFAGLQPNKAYEVNFHYRYESCKAAILFIHVGGNEQQLQFEGTDSKWGETSFIVQLGSEPMWVDIHPGREGDAADFTTPEHDDNLMWIDDFTLTAL